MSLIPSHTQAAAVLTIAAAFVLTAPASAGPINPPPGPVAPTPGPEPRLAVNETTTPGDSDASPSLFKITQPGSYYLTGNITGVAGKHGIEITSSGVTIDLNGFDLTGVAGSLDGINCSEFGTNNIVIRNGTVRAWGDDGVDMASSVSTANVLVENINADSNGDGGILVVDSSRVVNCSVLAGPTASFGIQCGSSSRVTSCTVRGGTTGIYAGTGSLVSDCAVRSTSGECITVLGFTLVSKCTVLGAAGNGIGSLDSEFSVLDCVVGQCQGNGIDCGSGGVTVDRCAVRNNRGHGIRATGDCLIRNNICENNGIFGTGAGIFASGNKVRIEGNHCTDADFGIQVTGAKAIIIGNSCGGNTTANYSIAAGNSFGAIVVAGTNVAAVNGNSAPSTLSTTDPNANFTY